MTRTFISLKERNFRYLILSTGGIGLGMWFQQIGLLWLMKVVTESPTQVGILAAIRGGTVLIAAPIAGVLSDRMSRRLLITLVTLASALQAVVLALLVVLNLVEVWHLYLFAFLEALTNGISWPVRQAFVYNVSTREHITNAIALNAMVQSASRIIGPNIAGALIGFVGIASCFFTLAVVKVAAAIATTMISSSVEQASTQKKESAWASLVGGFKYAATDSTILAILLIASAMPLLVYPYVQFLPFFADNVFHAGPQGFGLLTSALGVGAVPGGLLTASLGNFRGRGVTMVGAYLVYILMLILFSQQGNIWIGAAFIMAAGFFHSIATALTFTLLQLWVRNDMRGRVLALHSMEGGLQPLSSLPMGIAITSFGPQIVVTAACSLALLVISAVAVLAPQLRREPDVLQEEPQVSHV